MRHEYKITVLLVYLITAMSSALAHSGEERDRATGMMFSNEGFMHGAGSMVGYNMWGMGWFGLIFGILFWILVILAIIYLYQKITEE